MTRLKYYLDEHIPLAIAEQLTYRGIEVVTVRSLGLLGDEDVNHLERATNMGYVLCTNDSDFVKLAHNGFQHAGIIFGQQEKHGIGHWVKRLEQLHSTHTAKDFTDHVEYL
jgi:hypothetical protein